MILVYPLDSEFRETGVVIDDYESFIWTERFSDYGDFEMVIRQDTVGSSRIGIGSVIAIEESNRMMVAETAKEKPLADGGSTITYKGRSIESVLTMRVGETVHQRTWGTLLYNALKKGLLSGTYSASDKLHTMIRDENLFYPASSMPPSLDIPGADRWSQLSKLYSSANDNSPLGFRIVRNPSTKQLYYETYTGNDRSAPGKFRTNTKSLVFNNPDMLEADETVPVWVNLAQNPGFRDKQRNFYLPGSEYSVGGGATISIEDDPLSFSGKCLQITPSGGSTESVVYPMASGTPLTQLWGGSAWLGRTITVQMTVEVLRVQTGPFRANSLRGFQVFQSNTYESQGSHWKAAQAPNTVGRHTISMTFTLPSAGGAFSHFSFVLVNGSQNALDVIRLSDLVVIDGPSNPIGYFDGGYSPDPDLMPAVTLDSTEKILSTLFGAAVKGFAPVNCAFIQSGAWSGATGKVSARMINNKGAATHHAGTKSGAFSNARLAKFRQYQSEVLASPAANFGAVDMYKAGTKIVSGTAKPNTVTERIRTETSASDIDELVLRGNHTTFGGSIFWDNLVVGDSTAFVETTNDPVIFSEDLDTFVLSESHRSIDGYYNVAYVTHGDLMLSIDNGMSRAGVMRRVIHVDGSSLTEDDGPIEDQMVALGRTALEEHKGTSLIDGSVPSYSRYKYDKDYYLGDLVLVQDRLGRSVPVRVAEQIFVQDAEGFRTYPTLREETGESLGNWLSPEYNIIWNNAEPLGTWLDQP